MNGPKKTERRDVARNRERILDAASEVLAEDPEAGMPEIARRAGVSRATLYRHFGSRDELLNHLRDEAQQLGVDMLQPVLAGLAQGQELRIADLLDLVLTMTFEGESRYGALVLHQPGRGEDLAAQFFPLGEALFRRAQQAGELRADLPASLMARQAAAALISAIRSYGLEEATPEEARLSMKAVMAAFAPASGAVTTLRPLAQTA